MVEMNVFSYPVAIGTFGMNRIVSITHSILEFDIICKIDFNILKVYIIIPDLADNINLSGAFDMIIWIAGKFA